MANKRTRLPFSLPTLAITLGMSALLGSPSLAPGAELSVASQLEWVADKFVEYQLPSGQLSPTLDPTPKDYPHSFFSMELYKAYAATGNEAYRTAADKYFGYYLNTIDDATCGPARLGIALANWRDYKTFHPGSTALDQRMSNIYHTLMSYRWSEGSYFCCGYTDETDPNGLDVAFTCDLAVVGDGLLSYYGVTHDATALHAAEGLGRYFVAEMTPLTYNGAWSSSIGTWVVGPGGGTSWEHHPNTPVNDRGWGTGAQPAADYLIQLYRLTSDATLKRNIQEKCVESMKWQFDDCQFADGAVGMCGRDDEWVGMTAAAVQTFLWNYDAGFLSAAEIEEYRPKALAAADWILAHLDDDMISRTGYYEVTGQSRIDPRSHGYWGISWAMEALVRYDDLVATPEPSAVVLFAAGLIGLAAFARRKRS